MCSLGDQRANEERRLGLEAIGTFQLDTSHTTRTQLFQFPSSRFIPLFCNYPHSSVYSCLSKTQHRSFYHNQPLIVLPMPPIGVTTHSKLSGPACKIPTHSIPETGVNSVHLPIQTCSSACLIPKAMTWIMS